jgi:hypothetical protein
MQLLELSGDLLAGIYTLPRRWVMSQTMCVLGVSDVSARLADLRDRSMTIFGVPLRLLRPDESR